MATKKSKTPTHFVYLSGQYGGGTFACFSEKEALTESMEQLGVGNLPIIYKVSKAFKPKIELEEVK